MLRVPEKTHSDLEWSSLREELAQRCQTQRGSERALALEGFERPADARRRLELVAQCRDARGEGERLSLHLVRDLRPVLRRVEKRGALSPEDLLAVAATLGAARDLRRQGRGLLERHPALGELLGGLDPLQDLRGAIEGCFDETGALADRASVLLGQLRERARALREEAIGRLRALLADPAMQSRLGDDYYTDRDGRYVLPVKAERRAEVQGIVLGSSASGATVFVEPQQVIDIDNRIKLATADLEREEQRILAELSELVRQGMAGLLATLERLALIDLVNGAARLAEDLACGEVVAGESPFLELCGLRHPLMVLAGAEVVANDVRLSLGSVLVVTGPNTGGKTVLLKAVGLAALMLRAGLFPSCTATSRIPLFDAVLTDMGDDQSISESLSTFSAHVTNVGRLLSVAGPGALVLLDEVAVGTDPVQGAALARAILEALVDRGAMVLVTTHYPELKGLPSRDPRFSNASMGFDLERVRPTYRVIPDAPGRSSALSVARKLGLPEELLERAAGLLDPAAAKVDRLLAELESERRKVLDERERLASDRIELARRRRELERAEQELARERRAIHEDSHQAAVAALRGARDELERRRRRIRALGRKEELDRASEELDRLAARVSAHAPVAEPPPGRPAEGRDLEVGAHLWVQRLGGLARVLSVDRAQVLVQSGPLKLRVDQKEVRVVEGDQGASPVGRDSPSGRRDQPSPSGRAGHLPAGIHDAEELGHFQEPQTTCDLRGLRVDEAEEVLARFLDRMLLEEAPSALIIHGHGTGALRKLVRGHLRRERSVERHRPGRRGEGGDGVTVAFFGS